MAAPFDPNAPGHVCWVELVTPDRPTAKAFYEKLIGWESVDREMNPAEMCESGEGQNFTCTLLGRPGAAEKVAGMMQMDGPQWQGIPPHWMPYISVEDVDAKAARTTELGGKVIVPPMNIPNVGRFCLIEDPTGAKISLIQLGT